MTDALEDVAALVGARVRSMVVDATGWRWRAGWRGIELAAWNDIDGVAVVADIGPWDEWVGLHGHPADPGPAAALAFAVDALEAWLAQPGNEERIANR